MELTINGIVYKFKASIGFVRKVNKNVTQKDELGVEKQVGLTYLVAGLVDGEIEELINALDYLNDGMTPRVTREQIEEYIDNETTDVEKLFEVVIDFLSSANASKVAIKKLFERLDDDILKVGSLALKAGVDLSLWDNVYLRLDEAIKQ